MFSVGVDIMEVARFRQARYLQRVAEFFLTPHELDLLKAAPDKFQFCASRFALKEAVFKALPEPVGYYDFEIIKKNSKPEINFLNQAYNKYRVAISLSHTLTSAVGFALAEY